MKEIYCNVNESFNYDISIDKYLTVNQIYPYSLIIKNISVPTNITINPNLNVTVFSSIGSPLQMEVAIYNASGSPLAFNGTSDASGNLFFYLDANETYLGRVGGWDNHYLWKISQYSDVQLPNSLDFITYDSAWRDLFDDFDDDDEWGAVDSYDNINISNGDVFINPHML